MALRRTNVNCSTEVADDNCCDCVAGRQVVRCCQVFDADDDDNDSDFADSQAYSKKKEEKTYNSISFRRKKKCQSTLRKKTKKKPHLFLSLSLF